MKSTSIAIAVLLVAGMAATASADDPKAKAVAKGDKPKASAAKADDPKAKAVAKGEKPKASPGWLVIEEDWWNPFLGDFSTALHDARERYRAKDEKAASVEIDKAISWLKYAQDHADKATAEDLSTARSDLMDYSASLKSGKKILARKLDAAFANASVALAKHHHFRSSKAVAEVDMKAAGTHLMAAVELLRDAAESANLEYGSEAVAIFDDYAPFGYWDDTIVYEKSKLEMNLSTVKTELEKLAAKLKASK